MDLKLLFAMCLMLVIRASSANNKHEDFFKDISSEDDYYSDEDSNSAEEADNEDKFRLNDKHLKFSIPNIEEKQADDEPTEPPTSKYEVTELIDDIPNNTTVSGPIITNFTVALPFNNITATNFTDNFNNSVENNSNIPIKGSVRRNYISIFHIKAEYDNDKPEITVIQNNRPNFPVINGFRDYIKGIREGIINGIQSFVNNNNNHQNPSNNANVINEPNGAANNNNIPDIHNIVNAPVIFWNKLQTKTSDVSSRVRNAIFGRKFENNYDDCKSENRDDDCVK